MTKRTLIWIVIVWALLMLFNYYYMPYFFLPFEWFGLSILLLLLSFVQLIKLIKERNAISKLRPQKVVIFIVLFFLTFFHSTDKIIEKVDWVIFFNKRTDIVCQIKKGKLNPNVSWNGWICQLPFKFPVISNGGNDIGIDRYKEKGTITVTFWIFRNYFEAPSTQFIYTDDSEETKFIQEKIKKYPSDNWKIKENWFRTTGE